MAGIKNFIETVVRLNTAKAQKGAQDLFNKIKSGSKDASTNLKKVDKDVNKLGNTSQVAGGKVKAGIGGLGGLFTAMRTSVLSTIPALQSFKVALISTGVGAIVVALGAFVAVMAKAFRAGVNFSKSLSTLEGVARASKNEMTQLSDQAKLLGSTTAFTASEVVELQTELAKLGFTVKEIKSATPAVLDLAASLEVGLAEAAEFSGSVVRAFGLEASETQRVVDVMATSAITSAQSFESLKESFKLAAPTARALGVSVEETSALLGALANNGLKGSLAGTGLSKVFIKLAAEGLTLEEGLEKVRNSSDKLNTAIDLVGIIGSKSLLTLASSGDDIAYLSEQLEKADGQAKALAEIKLDNFSGDVTKLGSAWEGFLLSLEDGSNILVRVGRGIVQVTTAVLGFFTATKDSTQGLTDNRIELQKQKNRLGELNGVLEDSTSSEKELAVARGERKQIILDIQKEYPNFLKNIDIEKVSNEDLETSLLNVNKALINKIALGKEQAKIDEQNEDTTDALIDKIEAEDELLNKLAQTQTKLADIGVDLEGATGAEVIEELNGELSKLRSEWNTNGESFETNSKKAKTLDLALRELKRAQAEVQETTEEYNEENDKGNKLLEDKIKLTNRLNESQGGTGAADDTETETEDERKAREKAEADAEDKKKKAQKAEEDRVKAREKAAKREAKEREADAKTATKLLEKLEEDEVKFNQEKAERDLERKLEKDAFDIEQSALTEEQKREALRELQNQFAEDDAALDQAKLDKEREDAIAEVEALKIDEDTKRTLLKELNAQYDEEDKLLAQEKKDAERAQKVIWDEEDAAIADGKRVIEGENDIIEAEAALELARARGEDILDMQIALIEKKRAFAVEQEGLTADEIHQINLKAQKATEALQVKSKIANEESVKEERKTQLNAAAETFGISQELAVAQMIMKAPEAIGSSFTKAAEVYPAPLSLAMGAAGAAGVIVPIIKGLNDIKKARFPGAKKSGGGGGGNISASLPTGGGGGASVGTDVLKSLSANNSARLGDNGISNSASAAASNNVIAGASANVTFSETSYQSFRRQVQFKEDKTSI